MDLKTYSITEVCSEHEKITRMVAGALNQKDIKILSAFQNYLRIGYFPYFYEIQDEALYMLTLEQNLHTTIESDLAAIYPQLTAISIQKIKKLLIFIANSVPFTPNWQKIMTVLEIGDSRTVKNYFEHLEDAGLIRSLSKATEKFSQLEVPAKVFLNNPNQLFAISSSAPEIGTIRETYFLSMVAELHEVRLPIQGDFLVDQQYLFEIGGKNKSKRQLNQSLNGYLVCDGIEHGVGVEIPLWLFGFLY
jgi:predicted AAA+ superfamily ATPase